MSELSPGFSNDAEALAWMGTDAQRWARHFLSLDFDPDQIDEGLLIGWFANAIEAGRSATRQPNPADLIPPFRELIADMASEPPGGEVWDRSAKFAAYCARAKALIKDKNDE